MMFAGEDGNTPPTETATTASAISLPATNATVGISSLFPTVSGVPEGVADSGSFTVTQTGNTTPTAVGPGGYTLPVPNAEIQLSSTAGIPNSGTFTVPDSSGTETLNYTGISGSDIIGVTGGTAGATFAAGTTLTFPRADKLTYSGVSTVAATCGAAAVPCLTGVNGGSSGDSIGASEALVWPLGTGGALANLTPDQRRTMYSYFSYVLSPAAQDSEAGAGYAPLPANWVETLRQAFQSNF
jgi:hypothetical protein